MGGINESDLFGNGLDNNEILLKILDDCFMGVLVFNDQMRLEAANNYIFGLFGLEPKTVKDLKFCDVFLCSAIDKEEDCSNCPIGRIAKEVLENKKEVKLSDVPHEFIKNSRCDTIWFNTKAFPYENNGNNYAILTLVNITKQKYLESNLKNLGITDGQTSLYYRKYITEQLEILTSDDRLVESPMSMVLLDIDDLKQINDSEGTEIGDEIISCLAGIITNTIRHSDFAGRYGGEEFLLLLPDTSKEGACVLTERILDTLKSEKFGNWSKPVTFSAGILEIGQPDINTNNFLVNVKILLLRNKENPKSNWNMATDDDFE